MKPYGHDGASNGDGAHLRLPPHNVEAEERLLSAIFLDPALADTAANLLTVEDFYRASHQTIYRVMCELRDRGEPVEPIAVEESLRRANEWESFGERPQLIKIIEAAPHAANGEYHAKIVREKAVLRRLIAASEATIQESYAAQKTAPEIVSEAEARVFAVANKEAIGETQPIGPLADDAMERIVRRSMRQAVTGTKTGFRDLDDLTDGFHPGQLIVLAARPSMGKTALALNIAENIALDTTSPRPVLFVSLEMAALELAERLLASVSKVDGFKLRTGHHLNPGENARLAQAHARLQHAKIMIDDTPIRTPAQIAANARRQVAKHRAALIVVDYIQLITPGGESGKQSRQEQVASFSRRLKVLSKEVGAPVLALSQLNRNCELREDRRPRLADLRESGGIEQDADLVLLLYRPEFYDPNDYPGVGIVDVAKNRSGPTGATKLAYLKASTRFENLSSEYLIPDGAPF